MVAEVSGVATWEALAVDLHEGLGGELPVGAVGYEALVPLLQVVLDSVQEEPEPSTWIVSSSYLVLAFRNITSSLVNLPALELPCPIPLIVHTCVFLTVSAKRGKQKNNIQVDQSFVKCVFLKPFLTKHTKKICHKHILRPRHHTEGKTKLQLHEIWTKISLKPLTQPQ